MVLLFELFYCDVMVFGDGLEVFVWVYGMGGFYCGRCGIGVFCGC